MLFYFFLITVLSSMVSYVSSDPMKSSFFLILSMLTGMPLLSFLLQVWFSYFICLLFLSGIFVILVYFSSLSKVSLSNCSWSYLVGAIVVILFFPKFMFLSLSNSLVNFYFDINFFLLVWVVICLVFFMNFASYFLSFSGALRKI
uniref:NADH dehydrogenase subunit 6 n=1 Tax=Cucullanus robustus TaxID=657293 RepID=G4V243_9BILA|nr:NADH dehydrogenase subunit 6 [Cucullanus robustus]ACV96760.1 NADH dehydrogenase subunit 6 [Cucullanus robustus]